MGNPDYKIILIGAISFTILVGSEGKAVGSVIIRHAGSYKIQSYNSSLILTATDHIFRDGHGIQVGKVVVSEFDNSPSQVWDAIGLHDKQGHHFWLVPKATALNEITVVPTSSDSSIPNNKNTVEFIYYDKLSENDSMNFLIKSTKMGKCVQANGLDFPIAYENCDSSIPSQRFHGVPFLNFDDDDLARNHKKLYCKFKF